MSSSDHNHRVLRAMEEPLKLMAFVRTGQHGCFARFQGDWCVRIGSNCTCTCPDHRIRGKRCKHILKTILRILGGSKEMTTKVTLTSSDLAVLFEPNGCKSAAASKSVVTKKRKASDDLPKTVKRASIKSVQSLVST